MPIDFSRVNVSIQQFQDISSGKYNAGEIKLESETELGKINHHIHRTGSNAKSLSHEEVLAIKNAFVKVLSSNGVSAYEITRIRRTLGLAVDGGLDKTLHERSLRPLTRQQVREILTRNAESINRYRGADIMTRAIPSNPEPEGGPVDDRTARRNAVNNALARERGTTEHEGVALAEAVVAGDVDFRSFKVSKKLLAQARAQLKQILERSEGQPSPERMAVIEFRIHKTGQCVRIPTGMDEVSFVRKLEAMIMRLDGIQATDTDSIRVRDEFGALPDIDARRNWLDGLAADPKAGFKIRTVAVKLLTDAGIDDYETLSLVNRVSDADALVFAKALVSLDGSLRGAALRENAAMAALAQAAARENAAEAPTNARAYIPATSVQQWNKMVCHSIADHNSTENIPHDIQALLDSIPGRLRGRFGPDIIAFDARGVNVFDMRDEDKLMPENPDERLTAENIRERLLAIADRHAAETQMRNTLKVLIEKAGGGSGNANANMLSGDWPKTRPVLHARLLASRSAAETAAIFAEFHDEIAADVTRFVAVQRSLEKAKSLYRDMLAERLHLPSACVSETNGLCMDGFKRELLALGDKIRRGEIAAQTPEQVEAAARDLVAQAVEKRAAAVETVARMEDISPALRDALMGHVFDLARPERLEVATVVKAARRELAGLAAAIDQAISSGASRADIFKAMAKFRERSTAVLRSLFRPGAEVGADEDNSHGMVLVMTVIHDRPGFAGRLAAFLNTPEVSEEMQANDFNQDSGEFAGTVFAKALPVADAKEVLAASLGTTEMPPLHAREIMMAFDDAGLGALSTGARLAVLRASHPAGAAIAAAVADEQDVPSPRRLREIAAHILRQQANAENAARPPQDAVRMDHVLAIYSGGLGEADAAHLREFAESLDFSEEAAPASTKAVAKRLDEICGGGNFDNPASSVSRRALAAGFTLADLPVLARAAYAIESMSVNEEVLAKLFDPQSDFRRSWDAAQLALAGNNQANLAALSAEERVAAARAVAFCDEDADLRAVVVANIATVAKDAGAVRSEAGVSNAVAVIRANLKELRETAGGDAAVVAAGVELLKGVGARRVPAGLLKLLLEGARTIPLDAVSKLHLRSSANDIHAAVAQLNRGIDSLLAGRDPNEPPGRAVCRSFVLRVAFQRLSASQRRGVRDALSTQKAAQIAAFYRTLAADGGQNQGAVPPGVRERAAEIAGTLAGDADALADIASRVVGGVDAHIRAPVVLLPLNAAAFRADAIRREIAARAADECEKACAQYLQRLFPGNSQAANAMRALFKTRLDALRPARPAEKMGALFNGVSAAMLNLSIVKDVKILATKPLAESQFGLDRSRGYDVYLPGGGKLSEDCNVAADELARFVTGRDDATYAALSRTEKTKTHVVMSLLSQASQLAATGGPQIGLDPDCKLGVFNHGGGTQTRSFRLERDANGGITVRFDSTVRPAALVVDDAAPILLGQGDEIHNGFVLKFSSETLETLGGLDFASCDIEQADAVRRTNPPPAQVYTVAVNRLPPAFHFDLHPEVSFKPVLN